MAFVDTVGLTHTLMFLRSRRIRGMYLSIYEESAENILVYLENARKVHVVIWRMRRM
jgi:hypothetical protein